MLAMARAEKPSTIHPAMSSTRLGGLPRRSPRTTIPAPAPTIAIRATADTSMSGVVVDAVRSESPPPS